MMFSPLLFDSGETIGEVIDEICLRQDVVTYPYHICTYAFTFPRIHTYNVTVPNDRYTRLLPCQAKQSRASTFNP